MNHNELIPRHWSALNTNLFRNQGKIEVTFCRNLWGKFFHRALNVQSTTGRSEGIHIPTVEYATQEIKMPVWGTHLQLAMTLVDGLNPAPVGSYREYVSMYPTVLQCLNHCRSLSINSVILSSPFLFGPSFVHSKPCKTTLLQVGVTWTIGQTLLSFLCFSKTNISHFS